MTSSEANFRSFPKKTISRGIETTFSTQSEHLKERDETVNTHKYLLAIKHVRPAAATFAVQFLS